MHLKDAYIENIKVIITSFSFSFLAIYLVIHFLPHLIKLAVQLVVLVNTTILALIPIIYSYKIRHEIEKNFPFFIAFLCSISEVSISRKKFFELAGEAKEFGYLSKVMKKILQLAINLRLGFAEATKQVSKIVPKSSFKDFLDRFSSILEAGEELSEYLDKEFEAALDRYEVEYKRSLENIRILQEMLVAFMTSLGFGIVLIMIIPFLTGINILFLLGNFTIIFIAANTLAMVLSKYLVIEDKLLHDIKDKPMEFKKIQILFIIFLAISTIIFNIVTRMFPNLPMLLKLTLAITPLAYVSWKTILFEKSVRNKEDNFPPFLATLSGLMSIKIGSQAKAIDAIRIHDFKSLNKHIDNLYKRMVLTYDFIKSWYYFAAEIGSNLISKSILIFSRAVEEGGDPEKIGKKISDLFYKILDLRKMKEQFLSSTRGMFIGGYVSFVTIMYISVQIIKLLQNLFSGISELLGTETFQGFGFMFLTIPIKINLIRLIVDSIAFIQAFVVAIILRNIHGGSKYGMFIELLILLWIASLISIGTSYFFSKFFSIPIQLTHHLRLPTK